MRKYYFFVYIFFLIPGSYLFVVADSLELYIVSITVFVLGFLCIYLTQNIDNKRIKSIVKKFL